MSNVETWLEIRDLATESLSDTRDMTPENVYEVTLTREIAAAKVREHVGQVALDGLEINIVGLN